MRKTNPRERQLETVSVFDARKAVAHRLPDGLGRRLAHVSVQDNTGDTEQEEDRGFWKSDSVRPVANNASTAPLSHAEIETNSPYQPFHSDHRVSISVYSDQSHISSSSAIFQPQSRRNDKPSTSDRWVFGGDIPTTKLNITPPPASASQHTPQDSVMYRETTVAAPADGDNAEQVVSTTKRRKAKKRVITDPGDMDGVTDEQEEFFEDELEVLDTVDNRV